MIRIVCLHATVQVHATTSVNAPYLQDTPQIDQSRTTGKADKPFKNKNLSTNLNSPAHQPFYEPDDEKQMKTLKVSPKVSLIGALIELL